jgi:predicted regulator of Ras-like GTPase activity (Roadblock/LC7/MglB family)
VVDDAQLEPLRAELAKFRHAAGNVRGSIIGGVDGLLWFQEGATGMDPYDLAALAAAAYGIGRQTGHVLSFGGHPETTIHTAGGYFTVYSVNESSLLAVVGEAALNVARLHLEFRAIAQRLDELVRGSRDALSYLRPRF